MSRVIAMLAIVILAVAACSSTPSGGSATADPTIAFCSAVDTYAVKLAALDALTPSVTVDQYKTAVADAKTALAAVVAVAGPFVGAQLNDAQTAQTNLQAAADQLPATTTPAEAEAALQPLLQTLLQQVASTRNAICNTRPSPSA
jgi:DNA-binding LytR/AlgR family response regulator